MTKKLIIPKEFERVMAVLYEIQTGLEMFDAKEAAILSKSSLGRSFAVQTEYKLLQILGVVKRLHDERKSYARIAQYEATGNPHMPEDYPDGAPVPQGAGVEP